MGEPRASYFFGYPSGFLQRNIPGPSRKRFAGHAGEGEVLPPLPVRRIVSCVVLCGFRYSPLCRTDPLTADLRFPDRIIQFHHGHPAAGVRVEPTGDLNGLYC